MSTFRIEPYGPAHRERWNAFVRGSKNGTFLFERDYMEYHADRFTDFSLLCFREDELIAVLPASRHGDRVISHGGLTYGGVVSAPGMKTASMLAVFDAVRVYALAAGVASVLYKCVPHIYHKVPAEEDLYALFRHGATLVRRDVSATLEPGVPFSLGKGRKAAIKRAAREGVLVRESDDYAAFMALEATHLEARFGVAPVHSGEEMTLLASRFPESIRLFGAYVGPELVAGSVVYDTPVVAHAQYIGSSDTGRAVCALDLVLHTLITEVFREKRYFDFGISTEAGGRVLNAGLMANKESYGARATVYDFYQWDLG